jgi:hypothetical protein
MLGYANGRGLGPLVADRAAEASARRGGAPAPCAPGRPEAGGSASRARSRLGAVRDRLDGVGGLGWSVIGFIGGAVFWHFIGFWGFVSDVVLARGAPPPAARAAVHVSAPAKGAQSAKVADTASPLPACTLLSLDRRTGLTSARPCDSDHPPLALDSFQGRQDRIGSVGATESGTGRSDGGKIAR